jgi:hypothetical protein
MPDKPQSELTIIRHTFTPLSTMGDLYLNGIREFFTLEPAKDSGELVPVGTYKGELDWSPKFKTTTPHIRDVPGYDNFGPRGPIELHWGNYPGNTEGCALVGLTQSQDFVGESRPALKNLVDKMTVEFTIIYSNAQIVTDPELGV